MIPGSGGVVGSISRLWRYPVKSMLGEEVKSADVIWSGIYGNRCYALFDSMTSKVVSAKNPSKWGRAFECSSKLQHDSKVVVGIAGIPPARVVLPDGRELDLKDGEWEEAERVLSEFFGRQVKFKAAQPEPRTVTFEEYHAEIKEDPERGTTTEFVRPLSSQAGTFTDRAAVHLITTSTLEALKSSYPEGEFDAMRFRPNVLVDTGGPPGFPEREWVGRSIAIGEEVRLEVFAECGRCVMTTLPQRELRLDARILSTVIRENRGKVGVFASVSRGGRVKKGDTIVLA